MTSSTTTQEMEWKDTDELNHYLRPYHPAHKMRGQMEKEYELIVWKGNK
jgi:hypothetical protein